MERKDRPIKVIQFGEGNFLRGFVDWMVQKMNDQEVFNGSVAVVQPLDKGLIELLAEQDYTYTHILKGLKDGKAVKEFYKNDSIVCGNNPYTDFESFLALARIESVEIIVSNTTEAGITYVDQDLMSHEGAVSYPGKLTRLLLERFNHFAGSYESGLLILPCELIDRNADRLKKAVLQYIELWALGEDFKTWVLEANTFCNTLVDRIVPGYPRESIEQVWEEIGYKDHLLVESEQFNLWVIEGDESIQKKFPADTVGCNALFVADVTPYKMRKVRILNGAHTTLVPVALLYGLETVKESMDDEVISSFLNNVLNNEIIPTLSLPKKELESFAKEVLERFDNPYVKHYLMSIALNSMSKYETRVLPSLLTYVENKASLPKGLVVALASYIVLYSGSYKTMTYRLKDDKAILESYAKLWDEFDGSYEGVLVIVEAILGLESNWKMNLNTIEGLTEMLAGYVYGILNEGIGNVLAKI